MITTQEARKKSRLKNAFNSFLTDVSGSDTSRESIYKRYLQENVMDDVYADVCIRSREENPIPLTDLISQTKKKKQLYLSAYTSACQKRK